MSMRELVDAGAPELPEGWFYRVTTAGFGWPEVEIREPRRRWGSRVRSFALVRPEEHASGEEAVIAACERAWQRLQDDNEYYRKAREALSLRGDHDPRGGR